MSYVVAALVETFFVGFLFRVTYMVVFWCAGPTSESVSEPSRGLVKAPGAARQDQLVILAGCAASVYFYAEVVIPGGYSFMDFFDKHLAAARRLEF